MCYKGSESMKLIISNLTKDYVNHEVLNHVNYTFDQGKIYTIIGRNGAGKTTLFNCLTGNIDYNEGIVMIDEGNGPRPIRYEEIGMVSASPSLPDFLTGYEFIKFYTEINCGKYKLEHTLDEYFDIIRLNEVDRHKLIKEYSFGMKNKIQLLCCLIARPKIILLDEPLTSFDIIVSHDIKELLIEMKHEHIIIMSTHILQLAKDVSDEVVLLVRKELNASKYELLDEQFDDYIVEELKVG